MNPNSKFLGRRAFFRRERCAFRHTVVIAALLSFSSPPAIAKTPQQLKTDFAGIMPSGKKARMVWAQGTPSSYGSSNAQVYGVDSDDGQVRQITSGTLNADWPCITGDGSKVFFFDQRSGDIKIINWGGGTMTTLQANHVGADKEVSIESWVDPSNGSDWAIVGRACSGEIGRININNPSQCVKLWTCGSPCPSFGDGIALSLDGTRLGAMWAVNNNFASGVGNITSNTVLRHSTWIGCGVSMPADNSYRVSFADGEIRLSTGALPYQSIPAVSKTMSWVQSNGKKTSGCHDWFEMSSHRWTNNPGFLTVCLYSSAANPFLYRVSDDKFFAAVDDASCAWFGHPDVCFYSASTSTNRRVPPGVHDGNGGNAPQAAYSLDGRRVDGSMLRDAAVQRVVIRRIGTEGKSQLRPVLTAQ